MSYLETVERAANPEWMALMSQLVEQVARERKTFTSDDVFELYYAMPEDERPKTHEHRAFGPVMLLARRNGICERAPVPGVSSRRPELHQCPRNVWRSLLI